MDRPVHDRGGWPGAGPIDRREHHHEDWELHTDALLVVLSSPERQVMRVDELRRAIESIPPGQYETFSYYERWLTAIEAIMVEKGILTREEIERRVAALEAAER
jgi:nitrile hydratase